MSHRDPHQVLLETAGHEHAVHQRRRRRQLLEHEGDLASWQGALLDLAEAQAWVQLELDGGRRHGGVLLAVAGDHLLLAPDAPRGTRDDPRAAGGEATPSGVAAVASPTVSTADPSDLGDLHAAVSLTAVRGLRYVPGRVGTAVIHGDRRSVGRPPLIELLRELAEEGAELTVGLRGGETVLHGTALRVGADVLLLGSAKDVLTVLPTAAIGDVSWGSR